MTLFLVWVENSISATRFTAAVAREEGLALSVTSVFKNLTLAEMATGLTRLDAQSTCDDTVPSAILGNVEYQSTLTQKPVIRIDGQGVVAELR